MTSLKSKSFVFFFSKQKRQTKKTLFLCLLNMFYTKIYNFLLKVHYITYFFQHCKISPRQAIGLRTMITHATLMENLRDAFTPYHRLIALLLTILFFTYKSDHLFFSVLRGSFCLIFTAYESSKFFKML